MLQYANEAINFQVKSEFGSQLTKLFKATIEYRDSLDYDKQKKEIPTYFISQVSPKLKEIFQKCIGLNIQKIHTISNRPYGAFAVDLSVSSRNEIEEVYMTSYGYKNKSNKQPSEKLKEIINLHTKLDLKTSKLSTITFASDPKKSIFVDLFFDVSMAFLLHHYIPIQLVDCLTAEELTAIILHEAGHFLSIVERSNDIHYTISQTMETLKDLKSNYSQQEIIRAIADNKDAIVELANNPNIESLTQTKYIQPMINALVVYSDKQKEEPNASIFNILKVNISILISLILMTIMYYLIIMFTVTQKNITALAVQEITDRRKKRSDIANTKYLKSNPERDADIFAVRHGYGAQLASALEKIYSSTGYMTVIELSYGINASASQSAVLLGEMRVFSTIYGVLLNYTVMFDYEQNLDRLIRISQSIVPALKTLPVPLQTQYLLSYEQVMRTIDNYKKTPAYKAEIINKYIDIVLMSPAKFISMVLTGRLSNDYAKLQNQVEELVNNKLYYFGAKFASLAK